MTAGLVYTATDPSPALLYSPAADGQRFLINVYATETALTRGAPELGPDARRQMRICNIS